MTSIFNTTFEISLRLLLTLEASPREWLSADRIAAIDFITVYSKDFGLADENLHGENNYRYSEFSLRRELVKESLKSLVARGLVHVQATTDGFVYALGKHGGEYCAELESGYATNYRDLATAVKQFTENKPERELLSLSLINRYSLTSLQRSH